MKITCSFGWRFSLCQKIIKSLYSHSSEKCWVKNESIGSWYCQCYGACISHEYFFFITIKRFVPSEIFEAMSYQCTICQSCIARKCYAKFTNITLIKCVQPRVTTKKGGTKAESDYSETESEESPAPVRKLRRSCVHQYEKSSCLATIVASYVISRSHTSLNR